MKRDDSLDIESFYTEFLNDGFSENDRAEFRRNLNRCTAEGKIVFVDSLIIKKKT